MIILIYVHFNISISIFIKKEHLNNISFIQASVHKTAILEQRNTHMYHSYPLFFKLKHKS